MLKYLTYIENEFLNININNPNELLSELNLYKKMYCKYKGTTMHNPLYLGNMTSLDVHNFLLPTNESFTISWDIDLIYQKFSNYQTTHFLSLEDFNSLFRSDIENSNSELKKIYKKVKHIHSHTYNDILTLYFSPFDCNLILDGRHRYIEFAKLNPNQLINISYFNSNDVIDCIVSAFDLVQYIIINNIYELYNFLFKDGSLEQMISFEKCRLSL